MREPDRMFSAEDLKHNITLTQGNLSGRDWKGLIEDIIVQTKQALEGDFNPWTAPHELLDMNKLLAIYSGNSPTGILRDIAGLSSNTTPGLFDRQMYPVNGKAEQSGNQWTVQMGYIEFGEHGMHPMAGPSTTFIFKEVAGNEGSEKKYYLDSVDYLEGKIIPYVYTNNADWRPNPR